MLRGAIDHTTAKMISGWIYSDVQSVTNKTVLAFVDGICIGAGQVENFRPDLQEAGLGDGILGFHIPITPAVPKDALRAYVKLDGSDLALVQPGSRVVAAGMGIGYAPRPTRSLKSLEFMRQRGWLEQSEFDFLKYLHQYGVFDHSLRRTKAAAAEAGADIHDARDQAKAMFELILLEPVDVAVKEFDSCTALGAAARELASTLPEPVAAIFSQERGGIRLVEDSYNDDAMDDDSGLAGAIEYPFGPDRILFIDLRTRFGPRLRAPDSGFQLFLPS